MGSSIDTVRHAGTRGRSPEVVDAWCSAFEAGCRARGLRLTEQRRAVYRALAADPGHPTADALRERLRAALPSLSFATVYRVLDSLVREGMIRRVPSAGGGIRFDANTAPHQHLVCSRCGAMTDFVDPSLSTIALPARVPGGFRPESLDLRVTGVCAPCAGGGRRRTRRTAPRLRRTPRPSRRPVRAHP